MSSCSSPVRLSPSCLWQCRDAFLAVMLLLPLLSLGAAMGASWLLLDLLIPKLQRQLLDQPNQRSAHQRPTPRGGGVAFVCVSALASILSLVFGSFALAQLLPLLCLPLAVVGLLDDRHNLPAGLRYGVQCLTAVLLLLCSPLPLPATALMWLLMLLVLLVAVTAIINFTNFMDGLDGLVAGCSAVAFAAIALNTQQLWLWPLVGALIGFLGWNWSPAKVFMGDVGSTFLGAVFAGVVLQSSTWPDALGLLLLGAPLLLDACICVVRRWLDRQPVFQAHRLHLFQRLHQSGWPHARVASVYVAATAVQALVLLVAGLPAVVLSSCVLLAVGIWLDQRVAVAFKAVGQG